ncbi:plasmid pRiA4b ORF-3 family protein [Natrinema sp. SYSU A 869]|uniref:plasmid pRiA4b ORF-3 family protein n=1 Tax=Natrinema sp. SYSU A 869 TaxID=2871694 RepID=UPI001CA3A8D2|nr:plasmid pRiA4b ORF-3 family protein [Natrinema sp. SYSU A 869]
MTAYRFRVTFDPDPTSLWRDVVIGEDRSVDEFQTTINDAVGLDQGHLWFVGTDENYWDSDVKLQCPQEFDDSSGPMGFGEETYDAAATTVGDMIVKLDLKERDRICYLYDYGDEWRFYGILKSVDGDEPSDRQPTVVDEAGDTVEQYEKR